MVSDVAGADMPTNNRRGLGLTGWLQIATFGVMVAGGIFALGSANAALGNAVNRIGDLEKALIEFTKEFRASASVSQTELARHAVRLEMIERDRYRAMNHDR